MKDITILEYVANGEPWYIVCAAFHKDFDDPNELIQRIFQLQKEGLISITKSPPTTIEPTAEMFKKQAVGSEWFKSEDDMPNDDAWWDIIATEKGFAYVKDRFR